MDNEIKKNDTNNTSTQKTVRLKPLVKQPAVGDNSTESQSVKKVSTNSGVFPKVGTQTGRISSIATNTSRVVKINSSLRSNIGNKTVGPNTTMIDFRTSELQMASSNQNSPATTRPAGAPKSVLNSLNLKPKVAEASVVEAPATSTSPAVPAADAGADTQTAAVPKTPIAAKPKIKIATSPAVTPTAPAVSSAAADSPTSPAAPLTPGLGTPAAAAPPTVALLTPDNTQTAAVPKTSAKPVINIKTNTSISDSESSGSDDSTVKLKRPERPSATRTNSVVPSITNKPTVTAPAAAAAPAAPTAAPSLARPGAPSLVKPSAAPTVKLNMDRGAGATPEAAQPAAPTVAAVDSAAAAPETGKLKLGIKKPEAPKAEEPEAPKPEAAAKETADAKAPKKAAKGKKTSQPAGKGKKSVAAVQSKDMPVGFHFSVAFLSLIFIFAAAVFCTVQYVNTYRPHLFGRYIQIPFMEQVGK